MAVVLLLAVHTVACCQESARPAFLVPGHWPTKSEWTRRLGSPKVVEVTTPEELAARQELTHADIIGVRPGSNDFRQRLRRLTGRRSIEWVIWEGRCWGRRLYRIAGVFDPTTGHVVEVDGEALLDDWYGTS